MLMFVVTHSYSRKTLAVRRYNGYFHKQIASARWHDLDEFQRRAILLQRAIISAKPMSSRGVDTQN
jgi:hypothetical protein